MNGVRRMEIDRLDIVIATSVEKAKNQINQLKNEIEGVKTSLNGVKKNDSMSQTSKGAGKAAQEVRNHTKRMVADYKKAAKSMSSIRDEMYKKPIKMPVSFEDAEKQLANFQRQFEKAKDYVMSARQRGEAQGKVYRSNVENMYNAARGASQIRAYMRRRQEENLADLTPEQKAFAERLEKVKAGTWDYAKEAAEDAAKAAEKVRQANEQVVQSYKDIETSASKAYNIKYANPNKDLLSQAKDAQKGNEPFKAQFAGNTMWQNTVDLMKNTFKNFVPNIRYIGEQMRTQIGVAFDNMKAKADSFRASMREKAVASGILSYTQDFVTLQKSIAKTRAEYARLTEAMREYKESGGSESDRTYQRYTARANRLKSELDTARNAERAMKEDGSAYEINTKVAEANLQSLRNAFSRVADVALRTTRAIGKFVFNISGIRQAARLAQNGFKSLTTHAKKLWKEFERVGKMAKLMITRMAIRAILKNIGEGFQSLALHSEQFNATMSGLINSSKTLGYSIAGMVSPLINALAPALMKIIELATRAVNALNQLFSVLSGAKTWNRAKNFTDSWADSIKGAGSAASKAAKEIKKTVLGFDELNQLQDNKDSGGSGGAGGITDMFETVPIEQKWKDFAKWLKDMWEDKNFYDLGKLAGEKLRDALESIPWDEIRKTSNDLGKCLATLINGFVEVERLGYDIGYSIAQTLNTIFEFVNGFVHNLHWDSIGKFIADTFNGFFESIDWDLIEDTVITGIQGIATAINSFIKNFHWDNISNTISKVVNILAKTIYTFFKDVDWVSLAKNLGEQLNKTIQKIDWKQLGKTIGAIIHSAITFVSTFLKELDWETIKKAIGDLFEGIMEEVDTKDVIAIVGGIIVSVIGSAVAFAIPKIIAMKVFSSILTAAFGGTGGASTLMTTIIPRLAYIFQTIGSYLSTAVSSLGTLLSGTVGTVLAGIGGSILAFFGGAEFGKMLGTWMFPDDAELYAHYAGIKGTLEMLKDTAEAAWWAVSEAAKTFAERTSEHWGEFKEFFGRTTGNVVEASKTLAERTGEHLTDLKDGAKSKLDEVKEAAKTFAERTGEHWENAKTKVSTFVSDTKTKFEESKTAFGSFKDDVKGKLQTFATDTKSKFDSAKGHVEDFKNNAKAKFSDIKGSVDTFKSDVGNKLTSFGNDCKTKFNTAKGHIQTFNTEAQNKFNDFKSKVDTLKNDTVSKLSTFAGDIKNKFNEAKNNISTFNNDAQAKFNEFKSKISAMNSDVSSKLSELNSTFSSKLDTVKSTFSSFKDDIAKGLNADNWTFSGVADGLRRTFEDAKSAVKRVWNDIASDLNGSYDIGSSSFRISLPKIYAAGGFPEDGVFMANHTEMVGRFSNGKTAVANNRQIVAGIQSGVYDAVLSAMANSNNGASYISNEIIVDGETIARTITKAQQKQQRRYSPTMG